MSSSSLSHLFYVGFFLFCLVLVTCLVGPSISGFSPNVIELTKINTPPSLEHWFGTDELGRDLFSRVCMGGRLSLFIGLAAAAVDITVGVLFGGAAAAIGGRVEQCMMRFADLFYAIPTLLIVILIVASLGSGIGPILLGMTIMGWVTMARLVRARIWQLKGEDFVLAARALGANRRWIFWKHMLPNCMGVILVTLTLTVPTAIFTEAFLSFLGLGVQPPMASWGTMANEGVDALRFYPWRLFFPAIFICVTMLSFHLMGDGLRDAADPAGEMQ